MHPLPHETRVLVLAPTQMDGDETLRVLALPERDMPIEVDPVRMSRVLANLLANAAKYTEPKGKIEL